MPLTQIFIIKINLNLTGQKNTDQIDDANLQTEICVKYKNSEDKCNL